MITTPKNIEGKIFILKIEKEKTDKIFLNETITKIFGKTNFNSTTVEYGIEKSKHSKTIFSIILNLIENFKVDENFNMEFKNVCFKDYEFILNKIC
jgi:hypothetical protein